MSMRDDLSYVLTKTAKPSVFFETYRDANILDDWFPELKALIGVPQNSEWHQEGDVWNHTMMVLEEAAWHRERSSDPEAFMLSALCHDMGKAVCTEIVDGKAHAYSHEEAGVPVAEKFLSRLGYEEETITYVTDMVRLHMKPHQAFDHNSRIKKTNQMYFEAPDPYDLLLLAVSDSAGRIPHPDVSQERQFLYDRLMTFQQAMKLPYVSENDLQIMGILPDTKRFEDAAAYAHKLRMAMVDKTSALKQVGQYIRKQHDKALP